MTLDQILIALEAHPDSGRPPAEADPHRVGGFQGLRAAPGGRLVALWPWGMRLFADQAELEGWLQGRTPASWQD